MNLPPIREYSQSCYIYWYGPTERPTVKIGSTNEPTRRWNELSSPTGAPRHLARFAAVVWVDRRYVEVEELAHALAAAHRCDNSREWFYLTPAEGLGYLIAAAEKLGIRYEVEDREGVLPATVAARAEAARQAELAELRRHDRELSDRNRAAERVAQEQAARIVAERVAAGKAIKREHIAGTLAAMAFGIIWGLFLDGSKGEHAQWALQWAAFVSIYSFAVWVGQRRRMAAKLGIKR